MTVWTAYSLMWMHSTLLQPVVIGISEHIKFLLSRLPTRPSSHASGNVCWRNILERSGGNFTKLWLMMQLRPQTNWVGFEGQGQGQGHLVTARSDVQNLGSPYFLNGWQTTWVSYYGSRMQTRRPTLGCCCFIVYFVLTHFIIFMYMWYISVSHKLLLFVLCQHFISFVKRFILT